MPLGRTIKAVERNREPLAAPESPVEEFVTRTTYDIRGNVLTITDALGREAFRDHVYDYANRNLRMDSIDAGLRKTVLDALGGVIEQRDSKGALTLHGYDALNRPLRLWARDGEGQTLTLRERLEYGDAGSPDQPAAERTPTGRRIAWASCCDYFDEAGLLTFETYDFKGNLLEKTRRVVSDTAILGVFNPPPAGWQVEAFRVDWDNPAATAARCPDLHINHQLRRAQPGEAHDLPGGCRKPTPQAHPALQPRRGAGSVRGRLGAVATPSSSASPTTPKASGC